VYEFVEGAMALERLTPATSLATIALGGSDDEATAVLTDVMQRMSPGRIPAVTPAVQDWGKSFDRYVASGDGQIPIQLCSEARRIYSDLCDSQKAVRLLHGDLHHYNVLFDAERGWTAIDPKGVVGELEYEVGAALRNPYERAELFTNPETICRRTERVSRDLSLDPKRVLSWAFAQAVLSAIWMVEDGIMVDSADAILTLTNALSRLRDSF
jgi:streptomycin 6-kinase